LVFSEHDATALSADLDAECLSDEGFAYSGWAAQQDRCALFDEAAAGQLPDARFGDLGVVGKVDVAQIAHLVEVSAMDVAVD